MTVQHNGDGHEEIDLDISKRRFYVRTPNVSLLLMMMIIVGLCAYAWEVRLRDIDRAQAALVEDSTYHREVTERTLKSIEMIVKELQELRR